MIDKVFITGKLENFFRQTNPESFLKVFIRNFNNVKNYYYKKLKKEQENQ